MPHNLPFPTYHYYTLSTAHCQAQNLPHQKALTPHDQQRIMTPSHTPSAHTKSALRPEVYPMTSEAPPLIPSQQAIGYLIAAGGNSKLAAVSATRELNQPITEAQLLASITQDPNALTPLTQQLNLLLILNTVESLRLSHHAFIQALPQLSAKDAAQTYIKLLQTLTSIARPSTDTPPPTPTLTPEQILEQLPDDVQDAIKQLMAPPPP